LHTPRSGALDAGLRHRPFPDDTASLLPGLLTATRDRTYTGKRRRAYESAVNHLHDQPPTLLDALACRDGWPLHGLAGSHRDRRCL